MGRRRLKVSRSSRRDKFIFGQLSIWRVGISTSSPSTVCSAYQLDLWSEKNRTILRVDNFGTVNGRKAVGMSKVSKFCIQKGKTWLLVRLNVLCVNLHCTSNYAAFEKNAWLYPILTRTYSESNSNDHLQTELVRTKFNMASIIRFHNHHQFFW